MNHKAIERKSLTISSIVNGLSGLAGVAVYIMTDLNALLLDGVFSLIAFVSSLVAVYISKNSHKKTETFPQGLYFLEPLYAIMKSLATLLLLIFAVLETSATAFAYFVHGNGQQMTIGPAVPYTITMFLIYIGLYFYNRYMSAKVNHLSTIILAEAKGNLIDGLISGAIGIAVLLLYLIPINSWLGFLHYTGDFFLTLILALISFKEPWSVLVASFKELANGTVHFPEIHDSIYQILEPYLNEEANDVEIHIFKQGMNIRVKINLHNVQHEIVQKLLENKPQMLYLLRKQHEYISVEYAL
ncbi:cation transporter [Streptococcus ruminantium]|uniref:Cation transporter n=1 Tax=Streptococcus ruminantium TaxID=1917441 RepID=A0ABU1B1E9_9STRE|nr:cation transporter [Streptococcus ruminantium]MDQ8758915.1 cation transporter [Streptococcus ruminantium]MDQ8764143.1 cation transporter [Streptococcus ruminantium]MDQ8768744.1 cation transporter [Streptococcus ruminantium]MDQ8774214.1 cation transporter [Streptococcus ruminantium]MDQ8794067.1 cation transporter [Streptococcus ruminantium]